MTCDYFIRITTFIYRPETSRKVFRFLSQLSILIIETVMLPITPRQLIWWTVRDLNPKPSVYETDALTYCANGPYGASGWYRTNILGFFRPALRPHKLQRHMVGREGLEPPAYLTSRVYSPLRSPNFATYRQMVLQVGFEPTTPRLEGACSSPLGGPAGNRTPNSSVQARGYPV